MKSCDRCKYQNRDWGNNCSHPAVVKPDPVHGSLMVMCHTAREKGKCGPSGKLWEPTFLARLFRREA
jgi:hypothetical protein